MTDRSRLNSCRRNAMFLAGVSLAAVGLASRAEAQNIIPGPQVTPGVSHSASDADVTDLLTISNIGESLDFGTDNRGSGLVTATLDGTASGRFSQTGAANGTSPEGLATLTIANAGEARIGASADATATGTAAASAQAEVTSAVLQVASATGLASATLTNAGTLDIESLARAVGPAAAASGALTYGIEQLASGTSAATDLTNSGDLLIHVGSDAEADQTAVASANLGRGLFQAAHASEGDASVMLGNSGALTVLAAGSATGASAFADASIETGVSQYANAGGGDGLGAGNASATLTNSPAGTLTVQAMAQANASLGSAQADASVTSAIYQAAIGGTGDAAASLTNAGSLTISSLAEAVTTGRSDVGNATADASIESGIEQYAYSTGAGNAALSLANGGTLNLTAAATAQALDAANAYASVHSGISQYAETHGGGAIDGALENSGSLAIAATATATGASANAQADNYSAIQQRANAFGTSEVNGGPTSLVLTNSESGSIDITAAASANPLTGEGNAVANFLAGISQDAYSAGNDANVVLTNAGAITISAAATATKVAGEAPAGHVSASGMGRYGVYQTALAELGGNATASLVNSGSIAISATADAAADGNA